MGTDDADHQSMLDRITLQVERLSKSERKVAEAILADPSAFTGYTMARAAEVAGVSEPTVMRFAMSMGCDGYQALKIALAKSLALGMPVTFSAIDDGDSIGDISRKVFDHTITSLDRARSALDVTALERAVELFDRAPAIVFLGFGASNVIAFDAAQKVAVFGRPLAAPTDPHQAYMTVATLAPDSVVVAISNTGRTREVVQLAELAQQRGLKVVALTGYDESELLEHVDVPIIVRTFENTDRYTPSASRIAGLAVIDALAAAVAVRRGGEHAEEFRAMKEGLREFREGGLRD
ncbi:MAG TPA: MurR/RpiR family transcriptional regulator [Protaetiibacter sp.]|nr:MurR/RpiR family transcriptional regulator [Protaetiibacter sp.]